MPRPQRESGVDQQYVEGILDTGVSDRELKQEIEDLLADDYALGNLTSADREYFRLLAENIAIFIRETYPPVGSWANGDLGAALYDDPNYQTKPMETKTRIRIETALMDHFARSSRGVDGWQQDKLSESIETNRIEDTRSDEEEGITNLFSS
jgi:hypothetical protein